MKALDLAAAVAFLLSGTLTLTFGVFSIVGTGTGIIMASGLLPLSSDEQMLGVPLTIFYAVFMVVGIASGSLQLLGGIRLLTGKKDAFIYIAAIAGLAAVILVYCAPFGVIAFVLGLLAMLLDQAEAE